MNRTPSLADVEVVADGDAATLVFVRDLAHPLERVWAAISDPDELRRWAPYTADRDLGAPGPATLTQIDRDPPDEVGTEVSVAEPPRVLEHTWGPHRLRWELEPSARGTRLTLRHRVPDREWMPAMAAGWHICLGVADRALAGDAVEPIVGERAREHGWDELRDAYAERLGVEGVPWPSEGHLH